VFTLIFEFKHELSGRLDREAAVALTSGLAGTDIIRRDSVVQEFPKANM
jgi:hypothetical protein